MDHVIVDYIIEMLGYTLDSLEPEGIELLISELQLFVDDVQQAEADADIDVDLPKARVESSLIDDESDDYFERSIEDAKTLQAQPVTETEITEAEQKKAAREAWMLHHKNL